MVSRYFAIWVTCTGSSLLGDIEQKIEGSQRADDARAIGMRRCPVLGVFSEGRKEFLSLDVRGIFDGDRSSLGDDLGGSVWPLHARKARALFGWVVNTGDEDGIGGPTLNHCSTWATSAWKATRSGLDISVGMKGEWT